MIYFVINLIVLISTKRVAFKMKAKKPSSRYYICMGDDDFLIPRINYKKFLADIDQTWNSILF